MLVHCSDEGMNFIQQEAGLIQAPAGGLTMGKRMKQGMGAWGRGGPEKVLRNLWNGYITQKYVELT